jgi:IMP dehydrogenase
MTRIINREEWLTFDDVLLKPRKSLESRNSADTRNFLYKKETLHPIIPANMDTIMSEEMAREILKSGGIAVLHRYMSLEDRFKVWSSLQDINTGLLFISFGVSKEEVEFIERVHSAEGMNFCFDIAHGHSDLMADAIAEVKKLDSICHKNSIIMAGNIATQEGFAFLMECGADIIKVGIGPGSHCTTRIVTGCGVPQLSAILEIVECRENMTNLGMRYIPIIADGGLKNSGDIVKALAAGADYVMSGSLFAGCEETPGTIVNGEYKSYRGMASKDAQVGWKTNLKESEIVPEGEASFVRTKGKFSNVLHQLVGGLKSGMSYLNARTLKDLRDSEFIKVSNNTLIENKPHGKIN